MGNDISALIFLYFHIIDTEITKIRGKFDSNLCYLSWGVEITPPYVIVS